jgi:hypothetical protein
MDKANVIDFAAARRRIEAMAQATHSIEIPAARIPALPARVAIGSASLAIELEFEPCATILERLQVMHSYAELGELLAVTLEECK